MSVSDKRRPVAGTSPTHAFHTTASNPHRNSMPALPPRVAMATATATVPSSEEPVEGGASLKDKEGPTSRSSSLKDKDRDRERKERREKKEKRDKERDIMVVLGEKDEKIVELEKEMELMEREFQRELDRLSQNESETATFWQAKHSALNQQFLRTDTELRLIRSEVEVREAEREELREGWAMLRRELKERDDEIRQLRGQVRGLKEWVSNSTRTDGQTCDEVFGDGMTRLGNGLQNWVIVNFRKAKLNLESLDEATLAELNELVPMYEELTSTAKVHLLQSIVSRILVEMVFDTYFAGLTDEQARHFREMEKMLSSFASSDEVVNQWRSSTLGLLRRDASSITASTSDFTTRVVTRTTRLLDALCGTSPTEARDSGLRVLVNNSVELARLLVTQKAVLKVYMPSVLPHQRVVFEPDTMEDLGGEDEEALDQREISCVAFPGVIKHGDENGGHLQYKNVIVKARVLCSPE